MENTSQKRKPSQKQSLIFGLFSTFIFWGCAPSYTKTVEQASQSISDSLGCSNVQSKVFDAFYLMIDQEQAVPSVDLIRDILNKKLDEALIKQSSHDKKEKVALLKKEVNALVDLMLAETIRNPNTSWKEQIQKLIEYEMGDKSDLKTLSSSNQIAAKSQTIRKLGEDINLDCVTTPSPTSPVAAPITQPPAPISGGSPSNKTGLIAKGADMVFSTAYQSCRVLDLPEMDGSTSDVDGIIRTGTHEDGIGAKRSINDLKAVQNTHYYIRGIASESQCKDLRTNPLIYDYGGSPGISNNSLNFFVNSGSGTEVLGVDCSAYVSSAIAVAGLRYKPGLDNKPIYVRQTSYKFIDADTSGFACFENVTVTKDVSIKPGDIVGVKGHVLVVDKIGDDPFGLKLLKSADECNSLSYKNFDIVVSQSSPSKNGIGINKYIAKDYLAESSKMQTAFVEMGKQACRAYFQKVSVKPKSSEWGFLRHKGTAECLAPRVTMAGESCSQKCF